MTTKRRTGLILSATALFILIAILHIAVSAIPPKGSPGASLILKTLRQDASKIKDLEVIYRIDSSGTPCRIDGQDMTFPASSKVVADRLVSIRKELGPGGKVKKYVIPYDTGNVIEFGYQEDSDPNNNKIEIMFDTDNSNASRAYVQTKTRVSQLELALARLTGKKVEDPTHVTFTP